MSEYIYEETEVELDLKDIFADMLQNWKRIIIAALVCGALGMGYTIASGPNITEITKEEMQDAAGKLSVTDAAMVERLFSQYESYVLYKENIQNYFSSFVFSEDKVDNQIQKRVKYSLSTKLEGAQSIISQLTLTPELYDQIKKISPDEESVADVYHRIGVSSEESNNITLLNAGESTVTKPIEYILTGSIIANNREQCDEIQKLIEIEMQKQFDAIQSLDPDAKLVYIGCNYNENLRDWINSQQQTLISQLQSAETTITNFNNNQIKNLTADQKAYFDLLVKANADRPVNPAGPSKKKFTLLGLILGFVLSAGWIVLKYILSGDLKTHDELDRYNKVPVLNRVNIDRKKSGLFKRLICKLRDTDNISESEKVSLAASDIAILMNKNQISSLYMMCPSGSEDEKRIAEKLKAALLNSHSDYQISVGYPLQNSEELKQLYDTGNVIVIAQIKKTKRDVISKLIGITKRYGMNIIGAVTVEEF